MKNLLITKSATISPCELYRYDLWRIWDKSKDVCTIIGLNPSTADAEKDDATIRKCINYAHAWGYGSLCMLNLFAYRARQPQDMKDTTAPIGPENDAFLALAAQRPGIVIAAWGNHGTYYGRDAVVTRRMMEAKPLHCLKRNENGTPAHPLYLPGNITPVLYIPNHLTSYASHHHNKP